MKDDLLDKFTKDTEEEIGRRQIDSLSADGSNKNLTGFLQELLVLKNSIVPSRSLLKQILNDYQPHLVSEKIYPVRLQGWSQRIRERMQTVPAIVSVLAIVAVVLVVFLYNPFHQEQSEIAELKVIASQEKTLDTVQQSLAMNENNIASNNTAVPSVSAPKSENLSDPFNVDIVTSEANLASNYPNLSVFVSQEKSANAVNTVLGSF